MGRGKSQTTQQRTPTVTENNRNVPDDPQRRGLSAAPSPQSQALLAPAPDGSQAPGNRRPLQGGSMIG